MAFEKKSLINNRIVTQKAIIASTATPLSSKVASDPKIASRAVSKVASRAVSKVASRAVSKVASRAVSKVASRAVSKVASRAVSKVAIN
jgi:hypothetical protein